MFPIIFKFKSVEIHSYGFFISIGYLAGISLVSYLARRKEREAGPFLDMALMSMLLGVFGARVFFILTTWDYFKDHLDESFHFWNGGLVFYGGFLFALLGNYLYIKWKKLPIAETLDIGAPALALGHAFGRIGCLGAGCCHGTYCDLPWAITIQTDLVEPSLRHVPIHPTQAYEAIGLFLISILLSVLLLGGRLRTGSVALLYIIFYAGLRFIVEIFRGDSSRGFVIDPWLSTSQGVALVLFIIALIIFIRRFRSNQ